MARYAIVWLLLAATSVPALVAAPQEAGPRSYFAMLWQLDGASRPGLPSLTPHRSNYALMFSYNSRPNAAPLQLVDPAVRVLKPEAVFQLSLKIKVFQNVFGKTTDLWFGYTQRSFWQLYNLSASAPFRETNYEPEVLVNVRTRFRVLGFTGRFVQFGLNHQSNGRSQPLSRTWDRLVANAGFERGPLALLLKSWYHFPRSFEQAKNPDIDKYLGRGEIWGYYFLKNHRLAIMVRDNLSFRVNRGAVQLEWSFPLLAQVDGHVQYFLGYGESLLDYNHRVSRIGLGFVVKDWR